MMRQKNLGGKGRERGRKQGGMKNRYAAMRHYDLSSVKNPSSSSSSSCSI